MARFLIHILQAGGYLTLLPYLASAASASFQPEGTSSGLALAGITFLIIIGYGNTLARKDVKELDVTFWLSSIFFYTAGASLLIIRSGDGLFRNLPRIFTRLHDAFLPEYQPYSALGAVGELSIVAFAFWMPIASLLSMIVFVNALYERRKYF